MAALVCSILDPPLPDLPPPGGLLRSALDCAARKDWPAARDLLQAALARPEDRRQAHFLLWEVCQPLGEAEAAIAHLHAALRDDPLTSRHSATPRRRVLALAVPGDFQANLPLGALLDAAGTALHTLWLTDPEAVLREPLSAFAGRPPPPFDCVFIAIAEDARHGPALRAADRLAAALGVPVINRGERIAALSRVGTARLLRDLPHAIVPQQHRVERAALAAGALPAGLDFPVIIRPVASHAGRKLARIDGPAALRRYLEEVGAGPFHLAPFIDYSSADGLWRKYRVIFVGGRPWPCHMAVHADWAVWYYNAGMALDAGKQAEEARFLAHIGDSLPPRAMAALHAIAERVGLDYFGLDCGLARDGRLVMFEVETGMIVHDWDPPAFYPYKHEAFRRIAQAAEAMIDARIAAA
ncbi:MAG TPA: hypothetical protein VGM87_10350 [Roseomonas sp.]